MDYIDYTDYTNYTDNDNYTDYTNYIDYTDYSDYNNYTDRTKYTNYTPCIYSRVLPCKSDGYQVPEKGTRILFYGRFPNSFPPLRGTNSTTTNYTTGAANSNTFLSRTFLKYFCKSLS